MLVLLHYEMCKKKKLQASFPVFHTVPLAKLTNLRLLDTGNQESKYILPEMSTYCLQIHCKLSTLYSFYLHRHISTPCAYFHFCVVKNQQHTSLPEAE